MCPGRRSEEKDAREGAEQYLALDNEVAEGGREKERGGGGKYFSGV